MKGILLLTVPIQCPVNVVNVHKRIKFFCFTWSEDVRFSSKCFTKRLKALVFIEPFLFI